MEGIEKRGEVLDGELEELTHEIKDQSKQQEQEYEKQAPDHGKLNRLSDRIKKAEKNKEGLLQQRAQLQDDCQLEVLHLDILLPRFCQGGSAKCVKTRSNGPALLSLSTRDDNAHGERPLTEFCEGLHAETSMIALRMQAYVAEPVKEYTIY